MSTQTLVSRSLLALSVESSFWTSTSKATAASPSIGSKQNTGACRRPSPPTLTAKTGGGGRHFYFQHPGGNIRPSAGKLGQGLDIRGDGAYVVAPPSQHESGKSYKWKRCPETTMLARLPEWLLPLITDEPKPKTGSSDNATAIVEGQRNKTLTSLAGTMRRRGLSPEAILQALLVENA